VKALVILFLNLFIFSSLASAEIIPFCSPRIPSSCVLKFSENQLTRPTTTYTYANEVPFKKCYSDADKPYNDCFREDSLLRHPFIFAKKSQLDALETELEVEKSEFVLLLTHGLSDGPYYTNAIAKLFHEKFGMPVVAIRLSGHGSVFSKSVVRNGKTNQVLVPQPNDLGLVGHQQWYADMEYGYRIASRLGKKLILGGFSMGGLLSLNLYKKHQHENVVKGLLFFSPALDLNFGVKQFTCAYADFQNSIGNVYTTWSDFRGGGDLIRYMRMSLLGACNIQRIVNEVQAVKFAPEVQVPVFAVMTTADVSINKSSLHKFIRNLKFQKKFFVISSENQRPDEYIENHFVETPVPHNFVMLDPRNQRDVELTQELNPVFNELEKSLTDFWTPILGLR
jgi:pimeloyl-ACP methyl ester carboxylesterase